MTHWATTHPFQNDRRLPAVLKGALTWISGVQPVAVRHVCYCAERHVPSRSALDEASADSGAEDSALAASARDTCCIIRRDFCRRRCPRDRMLAVSCSARRGLRQRTRWSMTSQAPGGVLIGATNADVAVRCCAVGFPVLRQSRQYCFALLSKAIIRLRCRRTSSARSARSRPDRALVALTFATSPRPQRGMAPSTVCCNRCVYREDRRVARGRQPVRHKGDRYIASPSFSASRR